MLYSRIDLILMEAWAPTAHRPYAWAWTGLLPAGALHWRGLSRRRSNMGEKSSVTYGLMHI